MVSLMAKKINIRPTSSVYATYKRLSYQPWTAIAEFVGLEVPEKQEEAVSAEEEPAVDEATTRAKAAVAKLRALLNSKKQEEQAAAPVQAAAPSQPEQAPFPPAQEENSVDDLPF